MLDPVRWSDRLQFAVVASVAISAGCVWLFGKPWSIGPVLTAWLIVAPAVFGSLIWRFAAVPWRVIATWTLPMMAWIAGALFLVHDAIRWPLAFAPAGIWLALFIFWTPPARWWYRTAMVRLAGR